MVAGHGASPGSTHDRWCKLARTFELAAQLAVAGDPAPRGSARLCGVAYGFQKEPMLLDRVSRPTVLTTSAVQEYSRSRRAHPIRAAHPRTGSGRSRAAPRDIDRRVQCKLSRSSRSIAGEMATMRSLARASSRSNAMNTWSPRRTEISLQHVAMVGVHDARAAPSRATRYRSPRQAGQSRPAFAICVCTIDGFARAQLGRCEPARAGRSTASGRQSVGT